MQNFFFQLGKARLFWLKNTGSFLPHPSIISIDASRISEQFFSLPETNSKFNPWISIFLEDNLGISKNRGTPKSSILIGVSIINHPFSGTPIFGNTHLAFFSGQKAYFRDGAMLVSRRIPTLTAKWWWTLMNGSLETTWQSLKTNECPLKRDYFTRKYIWTNHWFSGDMLVFRGVKESFFWSSKETIYLTTTKLGLCYSQSRPGMAFLHDMASTPGQILVAKKMALPLACIDLMDL